MLDLVARPNKPDKPVRMAVATRWGFWIDPTAFAANNSSKYGHNGPYDHTKPIPKAILF